jgi:hypothetical protein
LPDGVIICDKNIPIYLNDFSKIILGIEESLEAQYEDKEIRMKIEEILHKNVSPL